MYFNSVEFGKRMQEARRNAGLTQEQLAERLSVNRTHVTKMERGNRACSVDFLVELASVLHVTTDYLLIGTEQISDIKESLEETIRKLQNIVDTL